MGMELLLASAAAFLCAALLVFFLGGLLTRLRQENERQWLAAQRNSDGAMAGTIAFIKRTLLDRALRFQSVERTHRRVARDVIRANYPGTADDYMSDALFEGLMIAVIGATLCFLAFGPFSLAIPVLLGLGWAFWIRPSLLNADGEKRSRAIYRRIPYALDLSVLVLQTGGTLREALEVIAKPDDPMAEELRTALKEMDSGASQATALQNMSARVGLEPLDSIVMAINRGTETGAPMGMTLTTQAELFREKRLQEVEKLAVEAPAKMTFPNMMVMLSVLVIVLGPVIQKMATSGLM